MKNTAITVMATTAWAAGVLLTAVTAAWSGVPLPSNGPETVLGLYLWYQAEAIPGLNDGDVVTQWPDSGPRNIPLDQPSGRPVFIREAIHPPIADCGLRIADFPDSGLRTLDSEIRNPKSEIREVHPLGWGNGGARAGAGMFLEFEAGRLDLATGFSADATTPDQAYADHFGKPTLILCARSSGPMNTTTQITFNGTPAPVAGSPVVPAVHETPLNVGGSSEIGYVSPAMDMAEIILFSRLLSLSEQNRVGYYLAEKYGLETGFIPPEEFVPVELEIHTEPPALEAVVGFVGKGQQIQGTAVVILAPRTVRLREAAGPRVYGFDHWQGEVEEPGSFRDVTAAVFSVRFGLLKPELVFLHCT